MSGQRVLSVGEATTIYEDGEVEFVTHNDSIQPGRQSFANRAELTAYLGQELGGRPEGDGMRGSVTRKGAYSRPAADGAPAVTFGDPVLDAISSPRGELVIGGQTIDLRAGHEALGGTSGTWVGRTYQHANRDVLVEGNPLPVRLRRSPARKPAR